MAYIYIGDIEIFRDTDEYLTAISNLSKERRNKALSYKNDNDKLLSVMAGTLLEKAMDDFNCHYPLIRDGLGYLHSRGDNRKFFSLSHSGNLAVCVVSDKNIGIDIEASDRFDNARYLNTELGFVKKILSEPEKEYFKQNCNTDTISRIWTRKESYSKILGKGIAMDLRTINTLDEALYNSFNVEDFLGNVYMVSIAGEDTIVERVIDYCI